MAEQYADSWLKVEESLGGARPVLSGTADEMRAQFMGLIDALSPGYPAPSTAVRTDEGSLGPVKYCIYTPTNLPQSSDDASKPLLPVGVYYHPGGLVIGPSAYDAVLCRALAEAAGCIIVSVQYRLSPENKAPAHLDDALSAFEWAHRTAASFGGDPNRIFTMGASAGACLALSVARKVALSQSSASAVRGVVAFSPCTLHPDNIPPTLTQHSSYTDHGTNVPVIDRAAMVSCFRDAGVAPDDQDYLPALDTSSHGLFPPTYISTCGMDPVRDDGKCLAASLEAAGVSVRTDHYPGLPHCFWMFPSLDEAGDFTRDAAAGVKWVVDQM